MHTKYTVNLPLILTHTHQTRRKFSFHNYVRNSPWKARNRYMLSIFRLVLIKVALDLKKYPRKESSAIVRSSPFNYAYKSLLCTFHQFDTLPNPTQIFFPQGDFSITTAHGKKVARETPGDAPHYVRKFTSGGRARCTRGD